MSISHIIDKGSCPPLWTRIRAHRLHSCTDLQFDGELFGRVRLNNLPVGNVGDYLQTVDVLGVPTIRWDQPSFDPSVINPGEPNQVFVTDALGENSIFSDNLDLPGNLVVTGTSKLEDNVLCEAELEVDGDTTLFNTDIVGDLQFNGVSGAVGAVLTKTSGTTQSWTLPYQGRLIRYGTSFNAQDLNSSAGPTAVTFDLLPFTNLTVATIGSIIGISQPSNTQFTIGTTGTYDVQITGFIDSASTGPISSVVTLSLEVGGVELARTCVVVNTLSFVGVFPSILISAGTNVRILSRRLTGTGSFNTFGPSSPVPNFRSSITFALVNTLSP
jgi:hypothetical protein